MTPAVGETFGSYTIESLLGRGGMGAVYLAKHERLGRKVALKVISPELAHDEDFRARFLRESQLAASLDHPNVIPIYDADEFEGVLFLAMRYVDGPSLQALLRSRGSLSQTETLRIAEQIGGALEAAHIANLVHRDVKPANILIAGGGEHAYLCDFGLARHTSSQGLTRTGFFLGSIDYCAPEQIQGGDVDGRADVYSLGCVVFHCLAGQPPYRRETEFAVLNAHINDPPPSLSTLRPDLPRGIDGVIATAMAKHRDHRYSRAGAVSGALRKALGEGPEDGETRPARAPVSGADQDRVATVAAARPRHRRRVWIAAALVLAVLAAAGVVTAVLVLRSPAEKPKTHDPAVRTFVSRLETILGQSAAARHGVANVLTHGFSCAISLKMAHDRMSNLVSQRRAVLARVDRLAAVPAKYEHVRTLLATAMNDSVEADILYQKGFGNAKGCTPPELAQPQSEYFRRAARADTRATKAKTDFVAAFNPLASSFGLRSDWAAAQI